LNQLSFLDTLLLMVILLKLGLKKLNDNQFERMAYILSYGDYSIQFRPSDTGEPNG
jgi:hypothetical protein